MSQPSPTNQRIGRALQYIAVFVMVVIVIPLIILKNLIDFYEFIRHPANFLWRGLLGFG